MILKPLDLRAIKKLARKPLTIRRINLGGLEQMKVANLKKGFTLVEIMIVVAIIGIIIAIAVPAFLRARENARGRACQENLSKIDGAKEQYAIEKKVGNNVAIDSADLWNTDGTGYLKAEPLCPAGGTYSNYTIGDDPECSYSAPDWAVQHDLSEAGN